MDIFEVDSSGQVRWLEAARDLDAAMARLKMIAARQPGQYLIFDYRTGNKTLVDHTQVRSGQPVAVRDERAAELIKKLQEALALVMRLTSADMGTLQRLDPATQGLRIVASSGFGPEFLDFFRQVHPGRTSCGAAMETRQKVVVKDVSSSPAFAGPERAVLLAAGSRAVQSIPLINRSNVLVGVISPHYRAVDSPGLHHAGVTDEHLHNIAGLIESLHEDLRSQLAAS